MNLESRKSIDRGVIKVLKKIRISQNNTCINPKKNHFTYSTNFRWKVLLDVNNFPNFCFL